MNQIFILNKKTCCFHNYNIPVFYIGRGSFLGNPYTHIKNKPTKALFQCETREESISLFEKYIKNEIKRKNKKITNELYKIYNAFLISDIAFSCFCDPLPCHGSVIKKLIIKKYKIQNDNSQNPSSGVCPRSFRPDQKPSINPK